MIMQVAEKHINWVVYDWYQITTKKEAVEMLESLNVFYEKDENDVYFFRREPWKQLETS